MNRRRGFSLIELLIAVALSGGLALALVMLAAGAAASYRLQTSSSGLQDSARFALATLSGAIRNAGHHPEPWALPSSLPALTAEAVDGAGLIPDRLGLQWWSRRNCFSRDNTALDSDGQPRWYLRQESFRLSSTGNLARTCRYGADAASLTIEINNQGLVEGLEALEFRYAEDRDGDGDAERWVHAGEWNDETGVIAVRVALVLAGTEPVGAEPVRLEVLGASPRLRNDAKLRRTFTATVGIRGRVAR